MSYGKISERWTLEGCRVVTIRTVTRKVFEDVNGEYQGDLLTPVEHIFLTCPESDENNSEKGLTNATQ